MNPRSILNEAILLKPAKEEKFCRQIVKTFISLSYESFDSNIILRINDTICKIISCLDVFGDVLGPALKHYEHDCDLVDNFLLEDWQNN